MKIEITQEDMKELLHHIECDVKFITFDGDDGALYIGCDDCSELLIEFNEEVESVQNPSS